jgi:hypothetical protein
MVFILKSYSHESVLIYNVYGCIGEPESLLVLLVCRGIQSLPVQRVRCTYRRHPRPTYCCSQLYCGLVCIAIQWLCLSYSQWLQQALVVAHKIQQTLKQAVPRAPYLQPTLVVCRVCKRCACYSTYRVYVCDIVPVCALLSSSMSSVETLERLPTRSLVR